MEVLAIIPARGGSKGIPMKNIQKLAGKPLISYTISAAKNSKLISKIIVSTDNKKIAKIAKASGVEVPFLRPKKISSDNSSNLVVIKHALDFLKTKEDYEPEIIIWLQPTSPLRTSAKIDESIKLLRNSNADSVLSVTKSHLHPYRSFWFEKKYLRPFKAEFQKYYQRQLRPDIFSPTGEVYTFWHKTLKKYNSQFGKKIKPLFAKKDEFIIDIDNPYELFICEMYLKHWKNFLKIRTF